MDAKVTEYKRRLDADPDDIELRDEYHCYIAKFGYRQYSLNYRICGGCGTKPGQYHEMGCDVERCPDCGGQMIACQCDSPREFFEEGERLVWTGRWPGYDEAIEYDLWCRWKATGGWTRCDKTHPDAKPDLNTLARITTWDDKKRKYIKINN